VAAAAEGLRSAGCNVVDIGPSTAACLAFAVHHLQAAGGVLVGNPGDDSHTVGLKFWAPGPSPLSAGGSLEPIMDRYVVFRSAKVAPFRGAKGDYATAIDSPALEPARNYGELSRFQADRPYHAQMSEHYHALRPLRVVVDSASRPTLDFLQRLAAAVACEIIPSRSTRNDLPQQIRDDAAHFAVCIDGDGETCLALDEQGRTVPPEHLLLLLASYKKEHGEVLVLETETPQAVADRLEQLEKRVVTSGPRRADMYAAMRQHGATLGGGPSGRFWHSEAGLPLCDALMTVTRLLMLLSRSDEPFSQVLDRNTPPV
jgi:phosphomannomutase